MGNEKLRPRNWTEQIQSIARQVIQQNVTNFLEFSWVPIPITSALYNEIVRSTDDSPSAITTKETRKHKAVFSILQFSSGFTSSKKKKIQKKERKSSNKASRYKTIFPPQFLMHKMHNLYIYRNLMRNVCPCMRSHICAKYSLRFTDAEFR